ncbi:MAG: hypothetical protein R2704_15760 [Microthrixaceae bacterium]
MDAWMWAVIAVAVVVVLVLAVLAVLRSRRRGTVLAARPNGDRR